MLIRIFSFIFALSIGIVDCQPISPNSETFFGGVNNQAYLDWMDGNGSEYSNNYYMPSSANPENGAAVHWNIDQEFIYLAVAVRATGWVGFGIAEAGGMYGADVVLFEAQNPDTIMDKHILDVRFPAQDESQDWELKDSSTEGGFLIFEAKRALDTQDPQDRPIVFDGDVEIPPTRIIAAWGDDDDFTYHGLNRARSSIRFHGTGADDNETFQQSMSESAEGSFQLTAKDHLIPEEETEYAKFCFSRNDIIALGVPNVNILYAIGFEPLVDNDAVAHVHHFVLQASTEPNNDVTEDMCEEAFMTDLAYVWAPGEGGFALPEDVASPLFGDGGFQSFQLEIHYNNPQHLPGVLDSSGIRIYYTSQPRQYEMGILSLGDPFVSLYGSPVGSGLFQHSFNCPSSCSSDVMTQPVTVVREYLHMHKTGVRVFNEQIRDGEVYRTGLVDYWDFDQQGNQGIQQESFQILPGDSFRTSCIFEGNEETVFGLSSQEEMCMGFLFYYPKQHMVFDQGESFPWMCGYDLGTPGCDSAYEMNSVSRDNNGLERIFGYLDDITKDADDVTKDTEEPSGDVPSSSGVTCYIENVKLLTVTILSISIMLSF